MVNKEWTHRLHGDDLHDTIIFLVERYVLRRGNKVQAKLKGTKVFKDRGMPCEPDAFFEFSAKVPSGPRKSTVLQLYVVEVETNPTAKSILTKYKQYRDTYAGLTDLIVLCVDDYIEYAMNNGNATPRAIYDWDLLTKWIGAKMPFGDD